MVELMTKTGQNITADDDSVLYNALARLAAGGSDYADLVLSGCTVAHVQSGGVTTAISVTPGYLLACGRVIQNDDMYNINLSDGSSDMDLICRVSPAAVSEQEQAQFLLIDTNATHYTDDIRTGTGTYDAVLAKVTKNGSDIQIKKIISNGSSLFVKSLDSVALTLNDNKNLNINIRDTGGSDLNSQVELPDVFNMGSIETEVSKTALDTYTLKTEITDKNQESGFSSGCIMPFNNFEMTNADLTIEKINNKNNLKIKLDTKLMTNIDPITHKPIFTNGDLSSQVELPDGVPFPIMKYVDGASELTDIDGTEKNEFIPTGTAVDFMITARIPEEIKKYNSLTDSLELVTTNDPNDYIPTATATKKIADDAADAIKVPIPIQKYTAEDGYTDLDGTEANEFIPTDSAVEQMLKSCVAKASTVENGICVTGKKASGILPFATADFVPAEITYENAPGQLIDLVDTGEKLSNFAIDSENYIVPTGETDSGCIVLQLPVMAGVYTIKFPDSKVGITVDFWSRCGGIVVSKAAASDITESGFLEFAPADIVLIDSWTDSAIEKHTNGNDHYAQISVPTGGAFLYVQYAYKNGTTQYFDRIEVYNTTYENILNQTTGAGNSYVSKIGDWYIKDTEARNAIEGLKAEIATLRAALAEVKKGGA